MASDVPPRRSLRPSHRPRDRRRLGPAARAGWLALVALAVLTLAACDGGPAEPEPSPTSARAEAEGDGEEARLVRTVTPESGELRATRAASARIRALRDASVASGASARVVEILARPGDTVGEGALVIRLDRDQAELQARNARLAVQQAEVDLQRARRSSEEGAQQARASLVAAESNVRNLRDRVEEVRALVEAGGAARTDLTSLEAQLEQAEAQLVQARDAVARAGRSESEDLALLQLRLDQARVQAEQAQDAVDETEVRAPFAGTIAELYLETGEFAGAGQPAFQLQSTGAREAVFDVPPEDATRLLEQGQVTLRYGGRSIDARLVASARPAEQPRLVQLTARIESDEGRVIPTGAVGEVRYEVALAEGMLVPSGAIATEAGGTFVYVVDEGVAMRTAVDVLAEAGARAAVDGVAEDATVIHPRPLDVRVGTPVRTEP
jgi:multidrug efflux pump subunit AcrA (membrane-fusion protein)